MPGCPVPLGQGQHLLMAAADGCTSLYPGQDITPLLYPVRYKPLYPDAVTGMQWYHLIKETLAPLRLAAPQMALATLHSHNFAAAGDMEAALSPFMGFYFGHFKTPLLPLFLSFFLSFFFNFGFSFSFSLGFSLGFSFCFCLLGN